MVMGNVLRRCFEKGVHCKLCDAQGTTNGMAPGGGKAWSQEEEHCTALIHWTFSTWWPCLTECHFEKDCITSHKQLKL